MKQYLDIMDEILAVGFDRDDRTGVGTIGVFGRQMRFNLAEGFPLLTTKKLHLKSIIHELLWFLSGDTNIKYLKENGVKIWDAWADKDGNLGPVYGHQWRKFGQRLNPNHSMEIPSPYSNGVDQITELIKGLKENPNSRRHIVTAWNPEDLPKMALPPCHMMMQFNVRNKKTLDCMLYQRSCDFFLGVPFNIASYALLTMMIAQVCGYEAGDFVHTLGDTHLYKNQLTQAEEQLKRKPKPLPTMKINPAVKDIFSFKYEDFELVNYNPDPSIRADVAV